MEFLEILTLRGPNFWSRRTVLEAWVDLQELKDSPSDGIPGLYERLTAWLPSLVEHRCGVGERGGFLQRLREGTYPAHILEHVAIELQNLAGTPVGFGKARETSRPGVYKVAMRYREEQVGKACLFAGRELLLAAIYDRPFDVQAEVKRLRELADDVRLGPSTAAVISAAEDRGIPTCRLTSGSLVQLGQGKRQRRLWTAETDRTSAIAEYIAQDKELTKELLRACGVAVPGGRAVESAADAWEAARELARPVVVKPRDGNHGRAVFTQLTTQHEVEAAYAVAIQEGSGVLVEAFIPGNEHRLLVVNGKVVAAARGEPAFVEGNGTNTVQQLVDLQLNSDPRRGPGDDCPLNPVEFDSASRLTLERQGLAPDSVPPAGLKVLVQRNGNVAYDVTDLVHPDVAEQVVMAARVVGLDIAGIDLVTEDVGRPLAETGGAVVEVNAGPGLHPHLKPASGRPRPVGEAIIEALFPSPENGRIPVACVTGTNGKTVVTRLLTHLLRAQGRKVGMACSDGLWSEERLIERSDCGGPRSARRVLLNPKIDAAVLEAGRGGILREGLGFDRCDVAVVTNIGEADHLGRNFIETPDQMFTVKRCPVDVVLPSGTAVLKADDPLVAQMASLSAGSVTFFCTDPSHPVFVEHAQKGLRGVTVRDGQLVLVESGASTALCPLAQVPMTHDGRVPFQVENALAATAAAWALGLSFEQVRAGLASFRCDQTDAPGRFNVSTLDGRQLVIDDCHNVSALKALVSALDGLSAQRRSIVYSAGARRRDEDIVRQGELLAAHFDRVVLYDDTSAFDRVEGELRRLFRAGLARGGRVTEVLEAGRHQDAIELALRASAPGEWVVVQTEDLETWPTVERVRALAGRAPLPGGAA